MKSPSPSPRKRAKVEKVTNARPRRRTTRTAPNSAEADKAPIDETEAVTRMLQVMADPDLLGSSTSEKIRKSGLSKVDWYRHRNDSRFRHKMARACREALDDHTGAVLEALAESAQAPGRSGHADRKIFLQFVGHDASAASIQEETAEQQFNEADFVDMLMEAHKGHEHVLEYVLPPGYKHAIGLDPSTPVELLPNLQARRGLNPAKCAEYVARIRNSTAELESRGGRPK